MITGSNNGPKNSQVQPTAQKNKNEKKNGKKKDDNVYIM